MTAISAPRTVTLSRATPFERMLLRAASALDVFVTDRRERRGGAAYRRAIEAQSTFAGTRRNAEARGAMGLLPR